MARPSTLFRRWTAASLAAPWLLALSATALPSAQAALFEDDEARRAILELRQRVDTLQQTTQRTSEDIRRAAARARHK